MFVSKRSRFSPTLLCYLTLVLALASATQAINLNPPNHAQLSNRMIKKRGTIPLADVPIARGITLDPLEGAGAQPPSFSGSASSTAASASQSAIASSATPTSAPAASSTPLPSSDSGSASSQPSVSFSLPFRHVLLNTLSTERCLCYTLFRFP